MAIKRISNLDFLTPEELKQISLMDSTGIIKDNNLTDIRNAGKAHVLFECSYPASNTDGQSQALTSNTYYSKKLTYQALLSNAILPDTKKYLNESNGLLDKNNNDIVLSSVVFDDYNFTGDKNFDGNITVTGDISGQTINIGTTTTENLNVSQIDTLGDDKDDGGTITKYHFLASPHGYFSEIRAYNDNSYEITSNTSLGKIDITATDINLNHAQNNRVNITNRLSVGNATQYINIDSGSLTATGNMSINGNIALDGRMTKNLIVGDSNTPASTSIYGTLYVAKTTQFQSDVDLNGLLNVTRIIVGDRAACGGCNDNTLQTGDIRCNNIYGIAHHARWSDLAENYLTDKHYDPGTLIKFGGEKEVTIADTEVNGVISTKPGYVLNSELNCGQPIALAGRVPVKVKGKVKKFDLIYLSDEPGIGISKQIITNSTPIGKALVDKDTEDIGLVECVTKFQF